MGDGKLVAHAEVLHQFTLTSSTERNHITRGQVGLRIRF